MNVQGIGLKLPSIGVQPDKAAGASAGQVLGGFGDALVDAVETLDRLQKEPEEQGMKLAAGEPVELHDVMLAQDRASLGFQLAVQVRNKLVEAYQDVMRMQI